MTTVPMGTSDEMHAQAQAAEAGFRDLLELAPDPIIIVDDSGQMTLVNRQTEVKFGYSKDELLGQPVEMLIPERFRGSHLKHRADYFVEPHTRPMGVGMELFARRKDGTEFPVEISLGPMRQADGTLLVTSIVRDISDRKQAEAELKKTAAELSRSNQELQQFAYIASHDLQEPLRMVASFTQLLARRYQGRLDADADEMIGFAVDGARRMQALINDLLAYSRVGTQFKPESVDCQVVVTQAIEDLAGTIQDTDALVTPGELPKVTGDPVQLRQLFQNLISNAIKFRGERQPRVNISAQRQNGEWLFSVHDNGIGIEKHYADRIFVIFQRLHSASEYPGTGIGLAICKKVVERHGGRIWFESQPGEGTTFFFTLPVRPS